jgi:dTDP-4-amino-4,6-dideoxygalactose transaminase
MVPRTKVTYSLLDLVRSWFVGTERGEFSDRLSHRLSQLFGRPHVLLTASGRGALYFLLKALSHTTVVLPSYTCKAVIEAALLAGKQVVYVETEVDGFNIEPSVLMPLLSNDVIFIATHQFGIPCDIDMIAKLCSQSGAFLVEDAAASLGTRVKGRLTGTFGAAAFFSFDSSKLINVPLKGGFLVVDDAALFENVKTVYENETGTIPWRERVKLVALATALILIENNFLYRIFHTLVFRRRNRFTEDSADLDLSLSGLYRYRLAEWQAWIAFRQLVRLDELIERRRYIYAAYARQLRGCRTFRLPPEDEAREWACIRFPIRIVGDKISFYSRASEMGIDFAFSFTYVVCPPRYERAHLLAASVLDLPFYHKLSPREFTKVVSTLQRLDREQQLYDS